MEDQRSQASRSFFAVHTVSNLNKSCRAIYTLFSNSLHYNIYVSFTPCSNKVHKVRLYKTIYSSIKISTTAHIRITAPKSQINNLYSGILNSLYIKKENLSPYRMQSHLGKETVRFPSPHGYAMLFTDNTMSNLRAHTDTKCPPG